MKASLVARRDFDRATRSLSRRPGAGSALAKLLPASVALERSLHSPQTTPRDDIRTNPELAFPS